jgi:glycosyltransferase involved in cell wall biosynthesis
VWYLCRVRILLLEPYFSGSHRQWAEGLVRHSRHDIRLITHEGQFWKWRLAGGFVTIAEALEPAIEEDGRPDLLLASSMLDLAGVLGLARHLLDGVPAAIYFHENQITYPSLGRTRVEASPGLANWGSLLACDGAAFNSAFHREAFFDALPTFLGAYPDQRHTHLIPAVRDRCEVVPVGVDLQRIGPLRPLSGPATFLWNHRWDPDKALEDALAAFGALAAADLDFRVVLAGQPFVDQPAEYQDAIAALGDRVVHSGYLEEPAYMEALHTADAVLSTAHQEFFGVSVVEAMYAGALPILPDRLVYPERVPEGLEGRCLYRTPTQLIERLTAIARNPAIGREVAKEVRSSVERYDWSVVGPQTDAWLESVTAR